MKSLPSAVLVFCATMVAAGCAHSDPPTHSRHHASHHAHHRANGASNPDTADTEGDSSTQSPQDAGASKPALGQSARDSMGHPAIGDY